jgi:hypothetical protein
MRAYYLCSPAITSLALILLPLNSDGLMTIWAPCTALPYFALYARDLLMLGYTWADLPRVYALNLMLLPINLAGVMRSIQQMLLSRRSTFGRTPKIERRTPVPPIHVLWQAGLVASLAAAALLTFIEGRYYFTLCWAINAVLVFWGFKEFLGFQHAWQDVVSRLAVVSARGRGYSDNWRLKQERRLLNGLRKPGVSLGMAWRDWIWTVALIPFRTARRGSR